MRCKNTWPFGSLAQEHNTRGVDDGFPSKVPDGEKSQHAVDGEKEVTTMADVATYWCPWAQLLRRTVPQTLPTGSKREGGTRAVDPKTSPTCLAESNVAPPDAPPLTHCKEVIGDAARADLSNNPTRTR